MRNAYAEVGAANITSLLIGAAPWAQNWHDSLGCSLEQKPCESWALHSAASNRFGYHATVVMISDQ